MTKKESDSVGSPDEIDLSDCYYDQLLRVARSAGLDLSENRQHDALVDRLHEAGVERTGWNEFAIDGEPLYLVAPQSSSGSVGPTDTTILYGLPREATEEYIDDIRDALETKGFEVQSAGDDGEKYKIVLPAEAQEDDEDETGDADPEEMTREELYEEAQTLDIDGRSDMGKEELAAEVAAHR